MAQAGDIRTLKEFYNSKDDADRGFNPVASQTRFVGHDWRYSNNGIKLVDHDPWIGSEDSAAFHFRVASGYKVVVSLALDMGFYIGPDIIHSAAFNKGIMKEGGTVTSYYPLVNDNRFRAVRDIPHNSTGSAVDYQPKFELTMSEGDYISIDLSGGVSGIGTFSIKLGNDLYKYKEGTFNWATDDEGFELTDVWFAMVSASKSNNVVGEWYPYMTVGSMTNGSQLVMWGQPNYGLTWSSETDAIAAGIAYVEQKGGGDGYARVIMSGTAPDGSPVYYLSEDMSYWAPDAYIESGVGPSDLQIGDASTYWFDGFYTPDETMTWTQFQQIPAEDFDQVIYTYATDIRTKYDAILASESGMIYQVNFAPWELAEEPIDIDDDDVVIIPPEPPAPPTVVTDLDPDSFQYIYAMHHAGMSNGLSQSEMSPFKQFLLYSGTSRSGYTWLDQNSIRIREYSDVDAGWYDWINNDENLASTGAILLKPADGATFTVQLYSSDLGTYELTLYGNSDENTWNDRIEIDVDGNKGEIAHLKIVAGGVSIIDESSGFNQEFEISLLGYTLPSGEVITPPIVDPPTTVVIPPFNWGDLIIVSFLTVGALLLTSWVLKKGGVNNG